MIYFSADDYGLNDISSKHILQCAEKGGLNKISVFPNIEKIDLENICDKILNDYEEFISKESS